MSGLRERDGWRDGPDPWDLPLIHLRRFLSSVAVVVPGIGREEDPCPEPRKASISEPLPHLPNVGDTWFPNLIAGWQQPAWSSFSPFARPEHPQVAQGLAHSHAGGSPHRSKG